ncbi:MAG: hypothetical protein K2F85_05200, partial [Helicobacter sp.]|nr:hypothetical protein [Helicobacter sp.]
LRAKRSNQQAQNPHDSSFAYGWLPRVLMGARNDSQNTTAKLFEKSFAIPKCSFKKWNTIC